MNKVYKLAMKLKKDTLAVIKDYKNNHISYDFANGVVINTYCILNDMEDIWGIDLTENQQEFSRPL